VTAALGLKLKVCLVGDPAVGKTSLIRRFVVNAFDDTYLATIGAKVSKKEVDVALPSGVKLHATMFIWDIMGDSRIGEVLKDAYLVGVQGILAVADLTRRETFRGVAVWFDTVRRAAGRVPVVLAVNKADLAERAAFDSRDLEAVGQALGCPYVLTSAKTGENVEEAFRRLAMALATLVVGTASTPG